MRIILYQMKSDPRKIGKTKVREKVISHAILKEPTNVINPTYIIKSTAVLDGLQPNLLDCNYLYDASSKKYYFVNNIIRDNGGILQFQCAVDVLETYKDKLLQMTAFIERQENVYSPYIPDSELKITTANSQSGVARVVDKYSVGNLGNSVSYVISVNGGEQ